MSSGVWRVLVTREGDNWLAEVEGLEGGAHTYGRNLPALDRAVREIIVLGADLDDDQVDRVEIAYEYRTGDASVDSAAADLRVRRADVALAVASLAEDTTVRARSLVGAGWSVRDVAALLGISPQRVSQLSQAPVEDKPRKVRPQAPTHV